MALDISCRAFLARAADALTPLPVNLSFSAMYVSNAVLIASWLLILIP
jgi:hypothetical protein